MDASEHKVTDSLPRASLSQLLGVLQLLAGSPKTTFEDVRLFLVRAAAHRAPTSADAKWTTARDVISELQRLGYVVGTPIARQKSTLHRFRESALEVTDGGAKLADTYARAHGHAFDELLDKWLQQHPYFRAFLARLSKAPLYVPDITSVKDLNAFRAGKESVEAVASKIADICAARLAAAPVAASVPESFTRSFLDRFAALASEVTLGALDTKPLVDAVEDRAVVPALLAAEGLPFDPVTFQHLIKAAQEFLVAGWTSSHPAFPGRVVFATCDINPVPRIDDSTQLHYEVIHHGRAFALGHFESVLEETYRQLAGSSRSYVDAYQLRAIICIRLGIQPVVFATCLEDLLQNRQPTSPPIYTEIPFEPPPKGEPHIEINRNRTRVGRLKIASATAP